MASVKISFKDGSLPLYLVNEPRKKVKKEIERQKRTRGHLIDKITELDGRDSSFDNYMWSRDYLNDT